MNAIFFTEKVQAFNYKKRKIARFIALYNEADSPKKRVGIENFAIVQNQAG